MEDFVGAIAADAAEKAAAAHCSRHSRERKREEQKSHALTTTGVAGSR